MLSPESLLMVSRGSVVAPAGHGKTELIARLTGLGQRTLVLTHTHAGVHALRARMRRLHIDPRAAVVDTIASWASRYTAAFPRLGRPLGRMPRGGEWDDIYLGAVNVLGLSPVRDVIAASYDRLLVDEYQDCNLVQHSLVVALSEQLQTIVFGDPMQGIFGFNSPIVNWDIDVFPAFPLVGTLEEPMRWRDTNPELGEWISSVRKKLELGEPVDLASGPLSYLPCKNEYDLAPLFHELEDTRGTAVGIHCRRGTCDQLAKTSMAAYQAIEDIGCKTLQAFAEAWDGSLAGDREKLLRGLVSDAVTFRPLKDGEHDTPQDVEAGNNVIALYEKVGKTGEPRFAVKALEGIRLHSRVRTFRSELLRDTLKALAALAEGAHETLATSAYVTRQRVSHMGRQLPRRTVSTPLLLKGLEFDRVSIPNAMHFSREKPETQAKLFYVALSRARSSLVISSSSQIVQFPIPV